MMSASGGKLLGVFCRCPGENAKLQAWVIRRLITEFNRAARRGHFPRERAMQQIYEESGIPLPHNSRHWAALENIHELHYVLKQ